MTVFKNVSFGLRIRTVTRMQMLENLIIGALGTFLGIMGGYTGGKVETFIMRSVDVLMAFPSLIMGLMVLALLGPGIPKMIIAIGFMLSPAFVRVAHSSTLGIKENDYVLAARSIGVSQLRTLRTHILPNLMGEIIVLASVWAATAIRVEAPTPAWGTMIRDGTQHLTNAPWISLFPGLAILATVLAFNLLGDGLRDVMDPKSYE